MTDIPADIRDAAWNAAGHIYDPDNKSHSYVSDIIASAILSERDRERWMPIEQEPDTDGPFDVLLYFPNDGQPDFDGADYSTQIGRWDRTKHRDIFSGWFHQGTNHDCFEIWAVEGGHVPTHWQPLPAPPVTAIRTRGQSHEI